MRSLITKMLVVSVAVLLGASGYVANIIYDHRQMERELRGEIQEKIVSKEAISNLKITMLRAHVALLEYLASGDGAMRDASRRAVVAARVDVNEVRLQVSSPRVREPVMRLASTIDAYINDASGGADGETLKRHMARIEEASDAALTAHQGILDQYRYRYRQSVTSARRRALAAGAAVSLLFLIAIVYQITVLRALRHLLGGVHRMENGDFDFQVPTRRRDEIGELTHSFNSMVRTIRDRRDKLIRENVTDPLTGLFNQRHFRRLLHEEIERATRLDTEASLLMIDIDRFKEFNDSYGHEFGNVVLRETARKLQENLREIDVLVRYGGDEFAAILPGASAAEGRLLADRLESVVASLRLRTPEGRLAARVTLSVGGATFPSNAHAAESLIEKADAALYLAKEAGRACVRWFGAPDEEPVSVFRRMRR